MKYWPPVIIWDIARYLNMNCDAEITDRLMDEYKESKAYRYFTCGWDQEIQIQMVSETFPVCLLLSKVTPSQRRNSKQHAAWVSLQKSSYISAGRKVLSSYCTCTAGLHGTCSHVHGSNVVLSRSSLLGQGSVISARVHYPHSGISHPPGLQT